ncbi:MAG: hypothetical protein LBV66_00595 [Elusimicrobiota bacterium]|jgi:hypothetical protein|nr:hypothetical protein [Elusimicrobiota bacterium]
MKKILLFLSFLVFTAACSNLDVLSKDSEKSFGNMIEALPENSFTLMNDAISITSPDEEVDFIVGLGRNIDPYILLFFDAKPFVKAGLNIKKFLFNASTENIYVKKDGDNIVMRIYLNALKSKYGKENSPVKLYHQVFVLSNKERIGYHSALDHYGIDIGNGFMFEWAKDLNTNDKDIVFVLNPEPFIEAGIQPDKVEGWLYAKVPVMDSNGKVVEVYKFLKPFNLK